MCSTQLPHPRDRVGDLGPSAKLVYTVLAHEGPLTQQALVERTRLAARTVRKALSRLEEQDAVDERIYLQDARQRLYSVREE
jgi:DNA-binding MarR family transcriptional regulator